MGGDLGRWMVAVGLAIERLEPVVDRCVQFGAVGLGDQDAIAPALADRVDVRSVEAVAHHDLALVAKFAQLADQVAASHRLHREHHQLGLQRQGGGDRRLEIVVGQLGALHRDWREPAGGEGLLEDQGFGGAVGVVLGIEHGHALDRGVAAQGFFDRERCDHRALGRNATDEVANLGNARGGVGRCHHRNPLPLGDRIGGEGLLRQGGPDQGDHPLADQQVEGGDGTGLIGAAVFKLQLHRSACGCCLAGPAFAQTQTHALVLAGEVGVAGEGDGGPQR